MSKTTGHLLSKGLKLVSNACLSLPDRKTALATILSACLLQVCVLSPCQVSNPPPLVSLSITNLGPKSYEIYGDGAPGSNYLIQATSSLGTNWQALGIATGDVSGAFTLIDSNGQPQRFYRSAAAEAVNSKTSFNPTNVVNTFAFWNYHDAPVGSTIGWTDEVNNLVLADFIGKNNTPTNTGVGWYFYQAGFTNRNPFASTTNMSIWVVVAPVQVGAASQIVGEIGVSSSQNPNNLSFSTGVAGSTTNAFYGRWANINTVLTYPFGTVLPTAEDTNTPIWADIAYSGGGVYCNGAAVAGNVGFPATNMLVQSVGNDAHNDALCGYIKYLLVATNHAITALEASNLWVWEQTNGVINITNGLVAWYKMNDPSNSPTIADASGNGLTLTNFGNPMPVWTNGLNSVVAQALAYDGTQNTSVGFFPSNYFLTTHEGSVSCWTLYQGIGNGTFVRASCSTNWNTNSIEIFTDGGGQVRGLVGSLYGYNETAAIILDTRRWHHFVYAFDNTNQYCWFDGVRMISWGTPAQDGTTSPNNVNGQPGWWLNLNYFQLSGPNANPFLQCVLTDVRIYNRVLSDAEVDIMYRSPSVDQIIGSYSY